MTKDRSICAQSLESRYSNDIIFRGPQIRRSILSRSFTVEKACVEPTNSGTRSVRNFEMKKDLLNGKLIRSDLAPTHCGFTIPHSTLRQDKRRNSLIKRC